MEIIVFFIVVVCIIVSSVKSASSAKERNRQQWQLIQQQRRQYQQRPYVPGSPVQPYTSNGRYSGQTAGQTSRHQGQPQSGYTRQQPQAMRAGNQTGQVHTQAQRASNATGNAQKQQSTLDYLEQKARADQLQHQKEMREDAIRRERASAGRNMGGRYMVGDPVPNGARICKCGYCGAENVISTYVGNGYKCYFCWENIN